MPARVGFVWFPLRFPVCQSAGLCFVSAVFPVCRSVGLCLVSAALSRLPVGKALFGYRCVIPFAGQLRFRCLSRLPIGRTLFGFLRVSRLPVSFVSAIFPVCRSAGFCLDIAAFSRLPIGEGPARLPSSLPAPAGTGSVANGFCCG